MATSALVCINLKTRGKGEDGGGNEESTQQLVQALVDNGIIQLNHKATIRLVDSATTRLVESGARLVDSSTTRLVEGTARLVDSSTTRLVEGTARLVDSSTRLVDSASARIVDGSQAKIGEHELAKPSRPIALKTTTSGILLEAVEGCDPKVLLGQNRPILVGRNVLVGGRATPGVLHLLHEDKLQLLHLAAPAQPDKERTEAKVDTATTTTSDGEPIKLPENLESLPKADHFPIQRHRWNTNEEIAAILITFEKHMDWQSKEVKIRPKSGSMLLYSRKKVRYRRDGYCWKKRKDGKTTREDHMKLKVQGTECIYGCYVHSAILPTFHRRCYWLLQNPDIVLVHYLNVPYPDDNKLVSPTLSLCADKKQWTKEELISQLKPMFYSEDEPEFNNELEISTGETVEAIVVELLERQRSARASALCKQLECGCADSTCADAKTCTQPIRRIQAVKTEPPSDSNQVSSTTGSALTVSQRTMLTSQERQLQLHNIQQPQVVSQNGGNANGPLVLNLSQIQTTGGLLILNSAGQPSHQPPQLVHTRQLARPQKDRQQKREPIPMEMESSGSGVHQVRVTQEVGEGREKESIKFEVKRVQTHIHQTQSQSHQTQMQSQSQQTTPSASQVPETAKHQQVPQHHDTKSFYQTLDLSQEDIQQTLSANMPHSHNNRLVTTNTEKTNVLSGLEEIDFIDVSSIQHDDDVLVNLDAFDMLSEFPELDTLDHNHNNNAGGSNATDVRPSDSRESMETEKDSSSSCMGYREGTANITDFSPDWAYTEGGVKVLVTGPWYSTTSPYTVLFDSVPVPTTLVQSGVLRCFCPAHEVGFVSVQVACEGFVISNSVMFEYKVEKDWGGGESGRRETDRVRREESNTMQWPPSESLLRYTLLQRMDALAQKVDIKQEPLELLEWSGGLEDKLVLLVEEMTYRRWKDNETLTSWSEKYRGMTMLHLAACLGYNRLICSLIQWKTANPTPILNYEVDGLCQDSDGFTPMMRACGQGKCDTALLLLEWEAQAAGLLNKQGKSCVEVASSNGHLALAQQVHSKIGQTSTTLQMNQKYKSSNKRLVETRSLGTLASHESLESLNSQNENSIFIHPTQIHRNHSSMELHSGTQIIIDQKNSRHSSPGQTTLSSGLSKRPSVDSGIQLQSSLDNLSSLRTSHSKSNHKLSRFDRSMSLPVSSPCFDPGMDQVLHSPIRRMDFTLCDVGHSSRSTPSPELRLPDDSQQVVCEEDARVLTLAEQIIAAMPERIKVAFFTNESSSESMTIGSDDMEAMSLESPLLLEDQPSSSSSSCLDPPDFSFDHSYRYYDVGTPCSSLSPGSCLASPLTLPRTPSPPPTTADFTEFLHASNSALFEKDFSNLTLSDREQRELYEAAKVIQKAYRTYKGRKKSEQDKERQAAVLIQNCYRRYKQFAYFKQMTRAAMVIQNGYRSYCENKRFKKTQEVMPSRHQNSYSNSTPLKRTYSQRRQNQAARKIQQFMRQSKNKLQRERAEKERLDPCKGCLQN